MSSRNSGQSFQSMIKRAANSAVGHRVVQLLELFLALSRIFALERAAVSGRQRADVKISWKYRSNR